MRSFGVWLAVFGGVFALLAINMDVTVPTGPYGFDRVNNMGLMADRQNYLMLSIGAVVVGVLLFVFGKHNTPTPESASTSSPESQASAKIAFYARERDLAEGAYKLYLVKKFNIEKNETLGQFVLDELLFDTLEEALVTADKQDRELQNNASVAKEKDQLRGTLGNCAIAYIINPDKSVTVSAGSWSKVYPSLEAAVEAEGPVNV